MFNTKQNYKKVSANKYDHGTEFSYRGKGSEDAGKGAVYVLSVADFSGYFGEIYYGKLLKVMGYVI